MKTIVLFDVDGTLTKPRNKVTDDMLQFLEKLHKKVDIGIVGGSDLYKIQEQLGCVLTYPYVDYVFSENGLIAYKGDELINKTSLCDYLGEDKLKRFINFTLKYIAGLDIPVKRGTFIELRKGMMNVSPIGRNCSQEERDEFEQYDKEHGIRKAMIEALENEFPDFGLKYSIGGQISFDVLGTTFDKTYCLQFLKDYDEIYFFGDKTDKGGNDYEIYTSPAVKGNKVTSYEDTMKQCIELFEIDAEVEQHASTYSVAKLRNFFTKLAVH
jgi:phosphomannomutase